VARGGGYTDRQQAGERLAAAVQERLGSWAGGDAEPARPPSDTTVVLGLPRGGVPVAAAVAKRLGSPLGVLAVRKVGTPGQPELALGAVASGGVTLLNDDVVRACRVSPASLAAAIELARAELTVREQRWGGDAAVPVEGRTAVLVDDGLATGATMRAAVAAARRLGAARVVVAVPLGAAAAVADLQREADDVVCPLVPSPFFAVGAHYRDFSQVADEEVRAALVEQGGGG
jgi:putative phosphoribosyl transferase